MPTRRALRIGLFAVIPAGLFERPVRDVRATSPSISQTATHQSTRRATHLATQPATALRLARIFASGMVLQRDQPVVVWGWAARGTRVTAVLAQHRATTTTDARGAWRLTLPALPAGGPHVLRVLTANEQRAIDDVLIGDVWLASGQSNMEFPLSQELHAARDIPAARDVAIRQFKIPTGYAYEPQDSLVAGSWAPADSQHVGGFSAVAYHFARALRASTGVPIGIINSTWGGSNIESWIRRDAQGIDEVEWQRTVRQQDRARDSIQLALRATLGALPDVDSGLVDGRAVWAAPDHQDDAWRSIPVPGYWEAAGLGGLDGVAWYRTAFTLSEAEAAAGGTLTLDAIDDDDVAWVNGVEVGRTTGYNVRRTYRLPPATLRAGRNVLAVRVSDGSGGGGINGAVSLTFADGSRRSLAGDWKFKVARVSFQPDGQQINKLPGVLYNQMIHPIERVPVAGVIWYQGESNANNDAQARAYRVQFQSLIRSWRSAFGARATALPFLWVQLPNYGVPAAQPPLTAIWATQRESMEAALTLPSTGQAVVIDLGESNDIHPRNKRDVGERLALVARRVAYRESIESSGPTYRAHVLRGDTVELSFDHLAEGLRTTAGGTINGFAVAGADRTFAWANARIDGNRVLVWSDRVRAPVAVRYAWSNGPTGLTLTNSLGLPLAPFRTDRW